MINKNSEIDLLKDEIIATYDHLHSIPEVGWQEFKTSAFIESFLHERGLDPVDRVETGLIYEIDSGIPGPTVGLRADIDALGYMDEGVRKARHACGHDGHTTMVMYTALMMKDLVTRGKLRILFQPSEEDETRSGAKEYIKLGKADGLDKLVGIHVRPKDEVSSGQMVASLIHGALRSFKVIIHGVACHGGRPHQGNNPIDAATFLIAGVNAIKMDTSFHCTAKATGINAGGGDMTTVPDTCTVTLDLRARTNDALALLYDKVLQIIKSSAEMNGCTAEIGDGGNCVAGEPDPRMEELARESIVEALGEDALVPTLYSVGVDDFTFYTKMKPIRGVYLGLGCNLTPSLHSPFMAFEKDQLLNGIKVLTLLLQKALAED